MVCILPVLKRNWSGLNAVVRRFFCDDDIVNVRFTEASRCDSDKLGFRLEVNNSPASGIAHTGAQSTDELRQSRDDGEHVRRLQMPLRISRGGVSQSTRSNPRSGPQTEQNMRAVRDQHGTDGKTQDEQTEIGHGGILTC